MIKVKNLVFEYPCVRALSDVSFQVEKGSITALVGPNGAGKTTLLRCLAALDTPITGSISINDIDVLQQPRECHQHIGFLADIFGLYNDLSLAQSLRYAAACHNVASPNIEAAVQLAARRLHIEDRLKQDVYSLSRGLRQRLAIAQAIVHEPEVLLLDEPASGLDPESRKDLSHLFLELQSQGMTLVVSSHILAELDEYSSAMLIMRESRLYPHDPEKALHDRQISLRIRTLGSPEELIQDLENQHGIKILHKQDHCINIAFTQNAQQQHQLLKDLVLNNHHIVEFCEDKSNMQDAYLQKVELIDAQSG